MALRLPVIGLALLLLAGSPASATSAFDAAAEAYARGDFAGALAKWRGLAEGGDVEAQLRVGEMLRDREGVRWKDFEQAAAWFRRAGAQGHAAAQYALGRLHYEGFIVPRDTVEMEEAFIAAAREGHAGAQLTLGVIFEYGLDDIYPDLTEALKWYELAARGGAAELGPKIALLRERVRAKMTDGEIAAALELAEAWPP